MNATELKAILAQHKLWIESGRKKGNGADLRGANLRGANLRGANLLGVNLEGATFTTNFKKAAWFEAATFSEDQIAWVCLHPKFGEWESTLKWVKVEADAA